MKKNTNNKNQSEKLRLIAGRNAVFEALKHWHEKIVKLYYVTESGDKKNAEILNLASKYNIKLERTFKDDLQRLTKVENHQGFAALLRDDKDHSLKSYLDKLKSIEQEKICIVAVDSVEDPHNLGTIFRASECFGVDTILLSKNRGSVVNATVAKVAVGATELVHYVEVSNLASAIKELKKLGFWCVVADVNEKSIQLNEFDCPNKTVLIVGAEGLGVKKILKDEADFIVKIPQVGKIDSLNVSQATAVILYQMMCK